MAQRKTNAKYFVHAGLPKTGSTFLQRYVFPRFKGIHFIKKSNYSKRNAIKNPNKDQYPKLDQTKNPCHINQDSKKPKKPCEN